MATICRPSGGVLQCFSVCCNGNDFQTPWSCVRDPHVYTHTFTHTCTHTRTHTCFRDSHMHTHTHLYTQSHKHTHTNTRTHTHTHTPFHTFWKCRRHVTHIGMGHVTHTWLWVSRTRTAGSTAFGNLGGTATHSATNCNSANHCKSLQLVATGFTALDYVGGTTTECDALQQAAARCNTLQHIVTHCNRIHCSWECGRHCNRM